MYNIKILDSELPADEWRSMLDWMKENIKSDLPLYGLTRRQKQVTYEPDGDHDGFWVFTFTDESDRVKFILKWM